MGEKREKEKQKKGANKKLEVQVEEKKRNCGGRGCGN